MQARTADQARAIFESLVTECMRKRPCGRAEAVRIQKANIGYFSGYHDMETQRRVERLFQCAHPIFGRIKDGGTRTPEEAFKLGGLVAQGGIAAARAYRRKKR